MRADTLRIYKDVHTWTGIVAGLALFIAFYAGALTMFKEPIARWASPPSAGAQAVPLAQAPALIAGVLAQRPEAAQEFRLHLRAAEHIPARMVWHLHDGPPGSVAEEAHHDERRHYTATLEPAGGVRVDEAHPSELADFIDTLHRVVGLPVDNDPNRIVMGIVCVLYAVALVSGVIILLPTLVEDLFALRLGRNLKRLWRDAHNVVGVFSLPFHLMMALTAAVFAFHDGIYVVQDRFIHDGRLEALWGRPPPPDQAPTRDPAAMLSPEALVGKVVAIAPGFEPLMLQYTRVTGPRAGVRVWGRDSTGITRSAAGGFAVLDPYSGRIVSTDYLPGHQPPANATVTSFFTLHFGSFGGTPVTWMYFALGLAGAFLFYSGNLLWIESRRKRRGAQQTTSARWMSALTVGVSLGCVIGLSLTIAAAKWLHGAADLPFWHKAVYYAAFFGATGWACVRGAGRAAPELLWAAAIATVAIPLTSLVAAVFPGIGGSWTHTSAAALGVDLTALAGAAAFAWMACVSARRARAGVPDSVWAARFTAAGRAGPAHR
ncbi:MAG TPA: PepSY-associated TM helix domain-containing protein [Burkholderiaceae bacterium]|nr:PepSY-associated TM helix domain-containing protein [Burkholderiaceae bacterium]